MRIMNLTSLLGLLLLVPLVVGCGSSNAVQAVDPISFQGQVDTSLSPDLQVKQDGVRKLLNAFLEGVGDDAGLGIYAPGIAFREPFEAFSGPTGRLVRWDFNGPPKGSEVPVVLFFDDHGTGLVEPEDQRREERTYVVSGGGQRFTVSRK